MRFTFLLALLSLLVAPSGVSAEPITFAFDGVIEFAFGGVWVPGDRVAGRYEFNAGAAGVVPPDGIGVTYDAISSFLVGVGSRTITGTAGTISVHFDEPALGGESGYDVRMRNGFSGTSTWDIFLSLFDITFGSLVSDESIQTSPPLLTRATSATGSIIGDGGEYGFSLNRLARVSVPEPQTWSMFVFGLVGLSALRLGLGRRCRVQDSPDNQD